MNAVSKLLDIMSKPINFSILIAIFLTSTLLFSINFLPASIIKQLQLENLLLKYNSIILVILISSFFLSIVQIISMLYKKFEDRKLQKYIKETHKNLFNDEDSLKILFYLYETHPHARELPYLNQKVRLLNQYGLIVPAMNQWHTNPFEPSVPYILQPIAENKLKALKKK